MNIQSANDLRSLFLRFFEEKGHARIPSASVIPENDPTVLFTTAGMHPLVPYLMGEKHPMGTRLTDVQKCIRTGDIDEVGDPSHLTFFEMLGNWSLGDYFKEQMIPWSWEFLTSPEWLGLDPEKLAFTVFEGDSDCPRDEEAANLWRAQGVKDDHLFYLPKKHNWWGPAGITGPCGPDTEMFIITDRPPCGPDCSPACSCGRYLEIWNDVFMQYEKQADGTFIPLKQKNVDTGMGLERTFCVLKGVKTVYETEIFARIIGKIEELSGAKYGQDEETTRAIRIISDHMRTATFIIGDDRGVTPSNVDQGYVLRRLIRRAVRHGMKLGMPAGFTCEIAQVIIDQYKDVYPELERNGAHTLEQLKLEEERFQRTLKKGMAEFEKVYGNMMRKKDAFTALKADKTNPDAVAAALRQLPPSPDNLPIIERPSTPCWLPAGRWTAAAPSSCTTPTASRWRSPAKWPRRRASTWTWTASRSASRSTRRTATPAPSSASRAACRTTASRPPSCTPPPTCCTPRCARSSGPRWPRRAATSRPSACASISPSAAR